jgi:hypothetical protein
MQVFERDDAPMKLFSSQPADEGVKPTWRPIPAWVWMLAAVAALVIVTTVVTTWLLAIASAVATNVHRVLTCSGDCVHTRS